MTGSNTDQPFVPHEPSLMQQMATTFRGTQRGISIVVFIEGMLFFALSVLCVVRFFQVETVRMQLIYATSFVFFMMALMMVKIWYWMLIHRNELTRRLAHLERKIDRLGVK